MFVRSANTKSVHPYYDEAFPRARARHPRSRVVRFPMDVPAQESRISKLRELAQESEL